MKTNLLFLLLFISFIRCSDKAYKTNIKGHYKVFDIVQLSNGSNDSGLVIGKIIDEQSKSPLPYGWIKIKGTAIGVSSDSLGNYLLKIPSGRYKFVANSAGNTELTTKYIEVEQNKKVHIDFYLGTRIIR